MNGSGNVPSRQHHIRGDCAHDCLCAKTNERLQEFIIYFVHEFERKLLQYHLFLEGEAEHAGKFSELLRAVACGGGGAVRAAGSMAHASPAVSQILSMAGEQALEKLFKKLASDRHLKKAIRLVDLIDLSQRDKAKFRRNLVEAGFDIFQSFEMQFMRVTTDIGPKDAMHNLAKDAVNRAINYIRINKDLLITVAAISGESSTDISLKMMKGIMRPGFEITYEYMSQKKTWRTAALYEQVGILITQNGETTFYKKKKGASNTNEYGYRRLLQRENWKDQEDKYDLDYVKDKKIREFKDYEYILQLDDLVNEAQSVMKKIDDRDQYLTEHRIKELIKEVMHDIIEEIRNIPGYEEFREILSKIEASLGSLSDLKHFLEESKKENEEARKILSKGFEDACDHRQELADDNKKEHKKTQKTLEKLSKDISQLQPRKKRNEKGQKKCRRQRVWFNVRETVEYFTGREPELNKLDEAIQQRKTVAICGLSGVGKSELAIKFARSRCSDDVSVIWMDAVNREAQRQSFKRLCTHLKMSVIGSDGEEKEIRSIADEVYAHFSNRKCLFILDDVENCDQIKEILPSRLPPDAAKPRILITSNTMDIPLGSNVKTISLIDFTTEESVKFIRKSLGMENYPENTESEELAVMLHNFPLALQQAVTYIIEHDKKIKISGKTFGIRDYLEEYERKAKNLLSYESYKKITSFYDRTTFTALCMTLDKVKDHEYSQQALETLYIMAYFAPNSIPTKTFLELVNGDEGKVGCVIELLKNYSIVRCEKSVLNVHGLFQQVVRLKLQEERRDERNMEEVILNEALDILKKYMDDYKNLEVYTPHIASVWKHAYKYHAMLENFIFRDIGDNTACTTYFHSIVESSGYDVVEYILNTMQKKYPNKINELVNQKIRGNSTPLHNAVLSGDERIVALLIDKGSNVNAERTHKWTPLHFAAKNGYLEIVNILLRKCDSINAETEYGFTPLHLAVKGNFIEVVNLLLSREADVNSKTNRGFTPLHFAADNGCVAIVTTLLDSKADVNAKTRHEYTPLHLAAKGGHTEIFHALLEKGADVAAKTRLKFTPLHFAAENNCLSIVQALLSRNSIVNAENEDRKRSASPDIETPTHKGSITDLTTDINEKGSATVKDRSASNKEINSDVVNQDNEVNINAKDANNFTPLHLATINGHTAIVKILLDQNAEINVQTTENNMPLHFAARKGYLDIFNMLLFKGADLRAKTNFKSTLLHLSAENGHLSIVEILINAGAIIDAADRDQFTALHLAAMNGHTEVVKTLLNKNSPVNAQTTKGNTPLHLAAEEGHLEVFKVLIISGADIEAKNCLKSTMLHLAAENGHLSIVKDLLGRKVSIGAKDRNQYTPLHLSAMNGHVGIVNILLSKNASVIAANDEGNTPSHLAAQNGHLKILKALIAKGANDQAENNDKCTLLHLAAENGHLNVVQFLLDRGVPVDAKDRNNFTPVHFAAMKGHSVVANALLNKNGNINVQTNKGNTPLHLAAGLGYSQVVKVLIDQKADADVKNEENKTAADLANEHNYVEIADFIMHSTNAE